jgi:Methyltransferase domain
VPGNLSDAVVPGHLSNSGPDFASPPAPAGNLLPHQPAMVVVKRQPRAKRQQLLRAATASLVLLACVAALLGSRALGYLPAIANCALSLRESHGFFCEPDAAWRMRREVADWQHGRQVVTEYDDTFATYMGRWWQANYEPNFSCAFERRLGRSGDGGKWGALVAFSLSCRSVPFYFMSLVACGVADAAALFKLFIHASLRPASSRGIIAQHTLCCVQCGI